MLCFRLSFLTAHPFPLCVTRAAVQDPCAAPNIATSYVASTLLSSLLTNWYTLAAARNIWQRNNVGLLLESMYWCL